MAQANRHHFAARKNPASDPTKEYKITDPNFKPDLNGHFAGVKVVKRGAVNYVRFTDAQAKFYLAHAAIELVEVREVATS